MAASTALAAFLLHLFPSMIAPKRTDGQTINMRVRNQKLSGT